MLKITDKEGKTKFVLKDEANQPITIDELLLEEERKDREVKNPKTTPKKE